ncbi:phage tail tube protein [Phenylobacterium sp.]|uniref:phage tail tube protein n=1 Tax=Phenylobacterium sp. TaxID=1871053 RepID=UPI0025E2F088|nr:phage tail tube protein [Phenylobacterium sp.]MBX3482530.1 hypothetical protein [Phenylobacterium sp.]
MTTQALIGSGTLVELADGSSPNAFIPLGEVGDQDLASDQVDQVDATHMQSGRREELIAGLIRGTEGSCPMNWIPGSQTDSLLQDFISSGEQRNIRFSTPAAELLTRDDLAAAIVQFMDSQFVDPSKAADDVSPASIINGITPVNPTGTDLAALKDDVFTLFASFVDSNLSLGDAAWIMTQQQALAISMMENALGQRAYPGMVAFGPRGVRRRVAAQRRAGVSHDGRLQPGALPLHLAHLGRHRQAPLPADAAVTGRDDLERGREPGVLAGPAQAERGRERLPAQRHPRLPQGGRRRNPPGLGPLIT